MATTPLGGFANLSRYQQAAVQPQANVLDQFVQALNQGISLAQLPQTLQRENELQKQALILGSLKSAIAQQQLADLQNPDAALARKIKEELTTRAALNPQSGFLPSEVPGEIIATPGAIEGVAGDLTGITERPAGAPLGTPTSPIIVGGRDIGISFNPNIPAQVKAAELKAKYDAAGVPVRVITDEFGNQQVVPLRQFGGVTPQASALTYADGGNVAAPVKPAPQVKMIEKSDSQGFLQERPVTGGEWKYALNVDGTRVNVGIANKFFETESGTMTAPIRTPGGVAPTASPLLTGVQPPPAAGGFVPVDGASTPLPAPRQVKAPPKASQGSEQSLRKEFNSLPDVKEFLGIKPQFDRMQAAIAESKKGGSLVAVDQALINTFNKMLDEKSVVRESEYARTASDISVVNRVKGKAAKILQGGAGLTDEERNALSTMAQRFYNIAKSNYDTTADYYSGIAEDRGFDAANIVRSYPGSTQSFSSEQEARKAGKKNGDRVVINGVPGTLSN